MSSEHQPVDLNILSPPFDTPVRPLSEALADYAPPVGADLEELQVSSAEMAAYAIGRDLGFRTGSHAVTTIGTRLLLDHIVDEFDNGRLIEEKSFRYRHNGSILNADGLQNRYSAIHKHRRNTDTTSIFAVYLDLDNYKKVNDDAGHHAADILTGVVAELLAHNIRPGDLAGCLGGDEFLLLTRTNNVDDAIKLAERVRLAISEDSRLAEHSITASIGVAPIDEQKEKVTSAVDKADHAMYAAKNKGRGEGLVPGKQTKNRVVVYNAENDQFSLVS